MDRSNINLTDNNIKNYIEKDIERKINQLLESLPQNVDIKKSKIIHQLTINELYQNTIQTIIDVINDVSVFVSYNTDLSKIENRKLIFEIFFRKERRIYIGIILIILSFILYFIDSSST
tara:strand:+ start:149 stop:505 length:357 start_codon:yes stop_codon:yes gene_type:complete